MKRSSHIVTGHSIERMPAKQLDVRIVLVYLKSEDEVSGVMCSFNQSVFDADRIKTGNRVKIKGICAGYLMDIQLNKCSLEK